MKNIFILVGVSLMLSGCNLGYHYQIDVFSGGIKIATYNSPYPPSKEDSGVWNIYDSDKKEFVDISGTIISRMVKNE